jgi:hypothetical protein
MTSICYAAVVKTPSAENLTKYQRGFLDNLLGFENNEVNNEPASLMDLVHLLQSTPSFTTDGLVITTTPAPAVPAANGDLLSLLTMLVPGTGLAMPATGDEQLVTSVADRSKNESIKTPLPTFGPAQPVEVSPISSSSSTETSETSTTYNIVSSTYSTPPPTPSVYAFHSTEESSTYSPPVAINVRPSYLPNDYYESRPWK